MDRPRLLVADADSGVLEYLRRVAERAGYAAVTASTGAATAAALTDPTRQLVGAVVGDGLLDLGGSAVLWAARGAGVETPVLLVSGNPFGPARGAAAGDRRAAFLEKPFTPTQMLAALAALGVPPASGGAGPVSPG